MQKFCLKNRIFKGLVSIILVLCLVASNGVIIASAEDGTASVSFLKNGTVYSGSNTRYTSGTSPIMNIVNDQEDSNFAIGFLTFDISSLAGVGSVKSASFSFSTTTIEDEPQGLTFYYASKNVSSLSTGGNNLGSTSIYGTENGHIANAISYFEMVEFASFSSSLIGASRSYTVDLADAFNSAILDESDSCTIMIMQSASGGKSSTNGWTDTKITFDSSSALSVTTSDSPIDVSQKVANLKSAIASYEEKMSTGTVYTNMASAYTAYINCQKAYDAYYYGGKYSINFDSYTSALNNAIQNMRQWTKPTATNVPAFKSGEITSTNYATNCIWAETYYSTSAQYTGSNNTTYQEYHHTSVYLYDNNAPKIPMLVGLYKATTLGSPGKPKVWYANMSATGGLYVMNSLYSGDITDKTFSTTIGKGYHIASTATSSNSIVVSTGDVRYMANYYSVSESAANNGNYYVKSYPNSFVFGCSDVNDTSANKTETMSVGSGHPIYTLYYKPLLNKINDSTYSNYLKNVSSYKEGGLMSLMQAYDIATSINPKGYDYSSDTESKVITCANAISSAVSNFNSLGTPSKDSSAYVEIRNAIEDAKTNYSENPVISHNDVSTTRYSEDSYSSFKTALDEAKDAMKATLSNGYATTYNGKSINAISSNITKAISNLKYNYIVEFYSKDSVLLGSKVYTQEDYTDIDLYQNSPMVAGTNDERSHKTYSWEATELSKAEYGDNVSVAITEKETITNCSLSTPTVVTEPHCIENGEEEQECMICKAVYHNVIAPTGHSYTDIVVAPTCTQKGYTLHQCNKCDYSYTDNETDMIAHVYEETVVAPTCETEGYTAKKCTVCGYEIVEESSKVAPLGHTYTKKCLMIADCTSGEMNEYTCVTCGKVYTEILEINPNVHSHLIYARTVAPTEDAMGYDIYYCSYLCGYWEKRNIKAPTNLVATDGNYDEYLLTYNEAYKYIETDYTSYSRSSITAYWAEIEKARTIAEAAINEGNPTNIDYATKMIIEAKTLLTSE